MSDQSWPSLEDDEHEVDSSEFEGDERAWRNVHPKQFNDGVLSSQIYEPSERDEGKRSTAREHLVSATEHFREYTELGRSSAGVCGVALSTIKDVGLRLIDDSKLVPDVTGHASIDFRTPDPALASKRARKRLAKRLAQGAKWIEDVDSSGDSSDESS